MHQFLLRLMISMAIPLHAPEVLYEQRTPQESRLYKIISNHWKTFCAERDIEGRSIPKFVVSEFEAYLRCGILAYGFGRIHCEKCNIDFVVPFSCKGRGFCSSCGARKMLEVAVHLVDEKIPYVPVRQFVVSFPVQLRFWMARSKELCSVVSQKIINCITEYLQKSSGITNGLTGNVLFIQRFGSGANLNVHFHIIALDGAYEKKSTGRLKFYHAESPTIENTHTLVESIVQDVNNYLIKKGYLEEQDGLPILANTEDLFSDEDNLHLPAQAASISGQIAFGKRAGKFVRKLRSQTSEWPSESKTKISHDACIAVGGYSVHCATTVKAYDRERLEKLICYMARPAIADERISIIDDNTIRLHLKTPWPNGVTALEFTPTEFIEKLIALIPIPRFHLIRYYGVFAPRSKYRNQLPDRPKKENEEPETRSDANSQLNLKTNKKQKGHKRIKWAELLKRTFKIDVMKCRICQGMMKMVAMVMDHENIQMTLRALGLPTRAPPIAPARTTNVLW